MIQSEAIRQRPTMALFLLAGILLIDLMAF